MTTKEKTEQSVEAKFDEIYKAFRISVYRHIFSILGKRDGSLSAADYFSVETVYLLGNPTISEFAKMLCISAPNATYRIKSLMEKGYIEKQETAKKNTFRLAVTEKFMRYYHEDINYGHFILNKVSSGLTEESLQRTQEVLDVILAEIEKGEN